MKSVYIVLCLLLLKTSAFSQANFEKEQLVAWSTITTDSKELSAEQLVSSLSSSGLKKVAFDVQNADSKFIEELIKESLKKNLSIFALKGYSPELLDIIKKYKIQPQIWSVVEEPKGSLDENEKISLATHAILNKAKAAKALNCRLGLYAQKGWSGEPKNLSKIIEQLHAQSIQNVGIIYNFEHGQKHIKNFTTQLKTMLPYLYCVNLNGINYKPSKKPLIIGKGKHDKVLIKTMQDQGYKGTIGVIDQRDNGQTLTQNIHGLKNVLTQIEIDRKTLEDYLIRDGKIWTKPINPEDYPSHKAYINRDRIYNFYAKQALIFGPKKDQELIPAFIGLDSGKGRHWGNQNDADTWTYDGANKTEPGSMLSGVIRGKNLNVTKGFSIRLDKDTFVIFDADKKEFIKAWKGSQVKWSPVRFGLINGLSQAGGEKLVIENQITQKAKLYNGLFRVGERVIFKLDDSYVEAVLEGDKVIVKSVSKPTLGKAQWEQRIATKGQMGQGQPYAYDDLTLPVENPWNALFFVGGLDFISKDRLAICTIHGEVWVCDITGKNLDKLVWKRFASGLHQALGLKVKDGIIHVVCRDQIVALHDLNQDDEADFYECASNRFTSSPGGHDFITGLQVDNKGRFYIASGNQGVLQIDEVNKTTKVIGSGLRNPNGLAINSDGSVALTSVQEGTWTPASAINDMSQGEHFGLGGPINDQYTEPLLYLPRGIDNSSGGQAYIDSDKWGPVKGQWMHFSMGFATQFLLLREVIENKSQSLAVVLPGEFKAGSHRGRFSPYDGQLYVGGSQGWGNYGVNHGSLQRVRYTAGHYPYPSSYETRENGILLKFNEPQPKELANKDLWFAQHWNYIYSSAYGSKEYSVKNPTQKGHDRLRVRSVQYLSGGKEIFLEIPQLQPVDQLHLYFNGKSPIEFFATIHKLGKAYTDFEAYTKITKVLGKALDKDALNSPKMLIQACLACHHPTQKVVGPPFTEIRKMYKDNPQGIVDWAKNPKVKNPQLPPMPSFNFMEDEKLMKIANYILNEAK
ncbi:MAG: hypothetical protein NE334_20700 [Lentisphaeraceae bacterium]|nr:hypothetical protein [Lentisphaeraceae bacterium]